MARKARTPPPPRRVQAPKTRKDERSRRGFVLIGVAVVGLAAVGSAAAYFLTRPGESKAESVAQAVQAAGGTFKTFKGLPPGVHINDQNATPKEWNSFPPTSGPHHGQWVIWGQYEDTVSLAMAVHNLEHGGIVIWYGRDVPQEQVGALVRFYRDEPDAMLLAPLPRLGDKIALAAWHQPPGETESGEPVQSQGILAEFTHFDENAFETFRDTYRFQGPERIPPDSLEPGE